MRKVAEILKEMGFKEDAPRATAEAFLRHLQKSIPTEKSTKSENDEPVQLEFDFNDAEKIKKTKP